MWFVIFFIVFLLSSYENFDRKLQFLVAWFLNAQICAAVSMSCFWGIIVLDSTHIGIILEKCASLDKSLKILCILVSGDIDFQFLQIVLFMIYCLPTINRSQRASLWFQRTKCLSLSSFKFYYLLIFLSLSVLLLSSYMQLET